MNEADLRREIEIEFGCIDRVLDEIKGILTSLGEEEPSATVRTASAAYMSQVYSGIENILKRLARAVGAPIPTGENWHIALVAMFVVGSDSTGAPQILDSDLHSSLSLFRKFRHVVMHNYGFALDWAMVHRGMVEVPRVVECFRSVVSTYLDG